MITGHLYFADGFTFVLAHAWLLQLQRENYHHFEQKYAFKKSKIGKTCRTRLHEFSRSVWWVRCIMDQKYEWCLLRSACEHCSTGGSTRRQQSADQSQMIMSWLNFIIVIFYFTELREFFTEASLQCTYWNTGIYRVCHLQTWFSGGPGRAELRTGLNLRGLFHS